MTQQPTEEVSSVAKFWGGLLVAAGALITATCGGCTALVFVAGIPLLLDTVTKGDFSILATLPILLIGIVPTVVGVLMFRAGLKRFRPPPPGAPAPPLKSTIVE